MDKMTNDCSESFVILYLLLHYELYTISFSIKI